MLIEVNVDSLVGPTHHFGGLGVGNIASIAHGDTLSSPRQAALEGLAKAWLVAGWGVPQFMLMPPLRPRLDLLSRVGFRGGVNEQLHDAWEQAPRLLSAALSSSFMWTANAATVTPGVDSRDGLTQITLANLISSWHRAAEPSERMVDLERLCGDVESIAIHRPLPGIVPLRDEGAANHMRVSDSSGLRGLNIFVYGDDDTGSVPPGRFMARHSRAASESIARVHGLRRDHTFFLQQHPAAIAAGVFHNDVIATSHEHLLLHHELAYWQAEARLGEIESTFREVAGLPLQRVCISDDELPLASAVSSYFFNSQILTPRLAGEQPRMVMLCPRQCETDRHVRALLDRLVADPQIPIEHVQFVGLGESMANGGGPACLRLRLPLMQGEVERLNAQYRLDAALRDRLEAVVRQWYPVRLTAADFADRAFLAQVEQAVQATTQACIEG
jgi:succinylarginine dihydrolase